jgi:hypothetical protein
LNQFVSHLQYSEAYGVHLAWAGFELRTLVVISTDCIGSFKYNYHTITTTMALNYFSEFILDQFVSHLQYSEAYGIHLAWAGFELTMLVVISTDCIGSFKYTYHMITTAPNYFSEFILDQFVSHLQCFEACWVHLAMSGIRNQNVNGDRHWLHRPRRLSWTCSCHNEAKKVITWH